MPIDFKNIEHFLYLVFVLPRIFIKQTVMNASDDRNIKWNEIPSIKALQDSLLETNAS